MNKFLLFLSLISIFGYSQENYFPAKIIKSDSTEMNGFVRYVENRKTPQEFQFKDTKTSKSITLTGLEVISVDIINKVKYIQKTISVSKHSNRADFLDSFKEFKLDEKTKFIEELVDGEFKLYYLSDSDVNQFFYSNANSNVILPLLVKEYINDNKIMLNEDYKIELYKNVFCEKNILLKNEIAKLDYKEGEIITYFNKINECNSGVKQMKKQKDYGYLQIKGTLENNFIKFIDKNVDFETENKIVFGLGAEFEYILPLYKYFFSFVVSPTFASVKNVYSYDAFDNNGVITSFTGELKSSTLSVPLNLRIYPINKTNFKAYISLPTFITISTYKSKVVNNNMEYESFVELPGAGFLELGFRFKKFELGLRSYGGSNGYMKRNVISMKYNVFNSKK
ncbi:MAG: hypothetical protein A3G95_03145 [Flavobacteria bacterium RIFCSPLOWO2_12_FULL_31_7]|nr:MAG: hypothetical protein A3G95_03145 [Flavobacteria bacterium RIFCSPLOWO2_12_FULL_31_7]